MAAHQSLGYEPDSCRGAVSVQAAWQITLHTHPGSGVARASWARLSAHAQTSIPSVRMRRAVCSALLLWSLGTGRPDELGVLSAPPDSSITLAFDGWWRWQKETCQAAFVSTEQKKGAGASGHHLMKHLGTGAVLGPEWHAYTSAPLSGMCRAVCCAPGAVWASSYAIERYVCRVRRRCCLRCSQSSQSLSWEETGGGACGRICRKKPVNRASKAGFWLRIA